MLNEFKPLAKNKNFLFLWSSQILSQLTIQIMNFVLIIMVFKETGSTIATSLLWVSYALPAIAIGPLAAAFTDMSDRKKILTNSNFLQSLVVLIYAVSGVTNLFLIYGVAFFYSLINQFYVPSEFASLPSIVHKKDYPLANGLFFLTQQIAVIIGFSAAGIFHKYLGFINTLYICAGLLFLAYISVSFLPVMKAKKAFPQKIDEAVITFFNELIEGYRFLKSSSKIYIPFLLLLFLQIATTIVVVNSPVIATQILEVPIESAGYLVAAPAGLGALISSLVTARFLKKGMRKKKSISYSLILFAFTFSYLAGFAGAVSNDTLRLALSVLAIVAVGFSFVGIFIPIQTYIQEITPGGLRGRVFGNFWFLVTIATVVPVIISGTITEIFGVKLLVFVLSIVSYIGFLLVNNYIDTFLNSNKSNGKI